ncbi:MAG TPA: peptidylprolyl isomerase [Membranihabitans sp.]|nr:peptidylprolyl isomerase [Membranihabitans sp.]
MKCRLTKITALILSLTMMWGCNRPQPSKVQVTTNQGAFVINLYEETDQYRKNFINLVSEGFYDSLLFHRILPDVIIQGGDPESRNAPKGKFLGRGGVDYTIASDFRYVHTYGAVSGARLSNEVNPRKESSGSQFFIVIGYPVTDEDLDRIEQEKGFKYTPEQRRLYKLVGGIPQFDKEYSVFGEVTDGMDVVKKISRMPRDANDRPEKDVLMTMKITD